MEYNLADLFESVVDVVPDREALVYVDHPGTGGERRLTYAALDAAANRIAHHLADAGIRPGEHLGLHLYNGVEYLQTVLACLKARIVPVNVNYRYVEEELVYLYRDADLAALVFDAEFTDRVAAALPRTEKLRHLVRVGTLPTVAREPRRSTACPSPRRRPPAHRAGLRSTLGGRPLHHLHRRDDRDAEGRPVAPGGPVLRGALRRGPRGRAREAARGAGRAGRGKRLGITFFPAPPLMHGTSTLTAFIALNYGQRVVLHRKYVPEEVLRTLEKEKVSSISLVGDAMLRPLVDALRGPLRGTDLSALFSLSSSGAIMSDTVRAQLQELMPNVLLLNNFGSTESGSNGRATDDSGPARGFRLHVNERTQVVDPATRAPVAPGEIEPLAQRGHVPLGYHNDPAKTAGPSSSGTGCAGCSSGTWRPWTRPGWSPSWGAVPSASTRAARRSTRRRWSRP